MILKPRNIFYILCFLGCLWATTYLAVIFIPHDPLHINLPVRLSPPSLEHLCGTDELGRDMFSRIIVGFYNTISVSILALTSSYMLGVLFGSLAGYYYGRIVDRAFNWVAAILFSLPFLLVISAIMSVLEKNLFNAYLVLTAVIWVSPARMVRAGVAKAKTAPFVLTEQAMGKSEWSILCRSLIPMSLQPAFIFSFKYLPEIIGMEAGLSFLGLGVQPPNPGLGKMIFDSINYLNAAWWYAFFPALFLLLVVLAVNLFFRWLYRDAQEFA